MVTYKTCDTSQASECRSGSGVEVDQGIRTIWIRKMSMNPIVLICLGGYTRSTEYRDDSLHLIGSSFHLSLLEDRCNGIPNASLRNSKKIKLKKKLLQDLLPCDYAKLWVASDAIVRQKFNLRNATRSEQHS